MSNRVSGRDNTIINLMSAHTHDATGAVVINETEVEKVMGEADANVQLDQTGAGGSGAGATSERVTAASETGQLGTTFTEAGHKTAADVGVEEVISSVNASVLANLAALQFNINQVALRTLNDAQTISHGQSSNFADNSNLQNKIALVQWADIDNIVEAKVAEALKVKSG